MASLLPPLTRCCFLWNVRRQLHVPFAACYEVKTADADAARWVPSGSFAAPYLNGCVELILPRQRALPPHPVPLPTALPALSRLPGHSLDARWTQPSKAKCLPRSRSGLTGFVDPACQKIIWCEASACQPAGPLHGLLGESRTAILSL
eukprot:COSAG05_NODE_10198_length_578_cov_0.824635_1_plen_147_part_10